MPRPGRGRRRRRGQPSIRTKGKGLSVVTKGNKGIKVAMGMIINYMHQIETWAEAYDQEASAMSLAECETLYDDAFFEAMDLQ